MFFAFEDRSLALLLFRTKKRRLVDLLCPSNAGTRLLIYQHFYSISFFSVNRNAVSPCSTVICSLQLLYRSKILELENLSFRKFPLSLSKDFVFDLWSTSSHRLKVIFLQFSQSFARASSLLLSRWSGTLLGRKLPRFCSSTALNFLTSAYSPKFPPLRRTCTDPPILYPFIFTPLFTPCSPLLHPQFSSFPLLIFLHPTLIL